MYEIGDTVIMAPTWGSYIAEMRKAFGTNPIAKVIQKREKSGEYVVQDYLGCCWCVVEKEIIWLEKPWKPILFLW